MQAFLVEHAIILGLYFWNFIIKVGAKSALDQVLMSAQIVIHWITESKILENVLAIKDFLMMELLSVYNASINGKVIGFNIMKIVINARIQQIIALIVILEAHIEY